MGYLFFTEVLTTENDQTLIIKTHEMKNLFKTGLVALVIAVSFSACGGSAKKDGGDSTKVDSAAKIDSTIKKDSAKTDTVKKDSVKK
jgi:hypothetical protein